jgi:hypothetical protein
MIDRLDSLAEAGQISADIQLEVIVTTVKEAHGVRKGCI